MSGWHYTCPCGWSIQQGVTEGHDAMRNRVLNHHAHHLGKIYAIADAKRTRTR